MPASAVPRRLHLGNLKKRAKTLLRQARSADPRARLSDVQHSLARDLGFAGWPALKSAASANGPEAQRSTDDVFDLVTLGRRSAPLADQLLDLAQQALVGRLGAVPQRSLGRLKAECAWVASRGFASHFLVLADLMVELRRRGVAKGPGKGNDGCSLLLYALGVTDVNPSEYGLHYERLLSPFAQGLTLSLDTQRGGLQVVADALTRRFGRERLVTCSSVFYESLPAVTAVAVLPKPGPAGQVDRLRFDELCECGACAVICAEHRLLDIFGMVVQQRGKAFPMDHIPRDDTATFDFIAAGGADAVMDPANDDLIWGTLATPGICARAMPRSVQELADCIAADAFARTRPGRVEQFLRRDGSVGALAPELAAITAPTHGVVLCQEQVMEIASRMGRLRSHDKVRFLKSFRKPLPHNMRQQERFLARASESIGADKARDLVAALASDSWWFSRAHAVSYALLTYWAAYLQVHQPRQWAEAVAASRG